MENSDFYNRANVELHRVVKLTGKRSGDMIIVGDLLERGKRFIMSWLKDADLKEACKDDPQLFYYNVAVNAFCGGIAFADAWDKDPGQVKAGIVDTLVASQRDVAGLAADILGLDATGKTELHAIEDAMFDTFMEILEPYWDKEDPRPFLFQGLLAFFQTGVSYRLS